MNIASGEIPLSYRIRKTLPIPLILHGIKILAITAVVGTTGDMLYHNYQILKTQEEFSMPCPIEDTRQVSADHTEIFTPNHTETKTLHKGASVCQIDEDSGTYINAERMLYVEDKNHNVWLVKVSDVYPQETHLPYNPQTQQMYPTIPPGDILPQAYPQPPQTFTEGRAPSDSLRFNPRNEILPPRPHR